MLLHVIVHLPYTCSLSNPGPQRTMHPFNQSIAFVLMMFVVSLFGQTAFAREYDPDIDEDSRELYNFGKEYEWQQGRVSIPPYPEEDNLIQVPFTLAHSSFEYFVDVNSVATTENDVVLYTVVIKSQTGAKNVIFEGIHCDERSVKVFAYGDSRGRLNRARKQPWKRIMAGSGGSMDYRREMLEYYACDAAGGSITTKEILSRLENPENAPGQVGD